MCQPTTAAASVASARSTWTHRSTFQPTQVRTTDYFCAIEGGVTYIAITLKQLYYVCFFQRHSTLRAVILTHLDALCSFFILSLPLKLFDAFCHVMTTSRSHLLLSQSYLMRFSMTAMFRPLVMISIVTLHSQLLSTFFECILLLCFDEKRSLQVCDTLRAHSLSVLNYQIICHQCPALHSERKLGAPQRCCLTPVYMISRYYLNLPLHYMLDVDP
jgi:hypothetical protein